MGSQGGRDEEEEALPLFQRQQAKGRVAYRVFASTIFVGICLIWIHRFLYIPIVGEGGRWVWVGMFMAELCFSFFWVCTQSLRWNLTLLYPFKHSLSLRYEDKLPGIDIFVCTADPIIEPPTLVINTILSAMSYNYPSEKLAVYLSDDGGSDLTFYALLEASHFAKYWIPFCKKNDIEPMSPEAYFAHNSNVQDITYAQEWSVVKNLYEEMKERIESTMERGNISKEIRVKHRGFSEWNCNVTKKDHQSIVQIVLDGRDETAVDNNGYRLPTLVYVAREKRPQYPHHFKAGAMNALIRVASEISNGPIILNLDCDMYVNDSDAIREALCFFMDEEKGHEIAYVELVGMCGYDSAFYLGTGCFHRRESLCGKNYSEDNKLRLDIKDAKKNDKRTVNELEEASKIVASCSYEKDTQWGKEMGLVYGCPVEDNITGLKIQCRGWKSVYYCPNKEAFLGVAPNTLEVALIQHRRWAEGFFQIFLSKYCPFIYGHGKIKLGAQMGYCANLLWAPMSLPTLYYVIVPPLCLLHGIPLFPQASSQWFLPYAYVFISKNAYSIVETWVCGGTIKAWWNSQRMWVIRRTTAYFLAFIDTAIKQLRLSQITFAITPKVVTDDVLKRYEKEVMEFGSSTTEVTIIATLAMLNLLSFVGAIMKRIIASEIDFNTTEMLIPQMGIRLKELYAVLLLALLSSPQAVFGIRFVIDREECFSHDVKYEGDTVHVSFVVIKADSSWHYTNDGVDLVVKGPNGDQIQDIRDKISDKFEFMAHQRGVHSFCFTNKSPYHETIDFDVHVGHFSYYDEHAKDEHFKPLLDQIWKLEEALYNIQFEQHWLEAQTERQAIVNEAMGRRAIHKAFYESAALIVASILQVYLLRRLFERKLGMSRV
ncbi:hypothetical protein GH714_022916 [Hevea brasiliensis]|uniref:GOLD domain-containing protein n=1 Tax=Hevea brasiliensis TaxID=3981 RepID=A0A6A6KLX7_HEVBR|nr:hypothetical protein GH714_022916 [Hevea brasiliensis]